MNKTLTKPLSTDRTEDGYTLDLVDDDDTTLGTMKCERLLGTELFFNIHTEGTAYQIVDSPTRMPLWVLERRLFMLPGDTFTITLDIQP